MQIVTLGGLSAIVERVRQQKGVGEGDLVTKLGEEESRKGGACSQLKHSAPRLHLALIEPKVPFQKMSQRSSSLGQDYQARTGAQGQM